VRALLDSHLLVWISEDSPKLPKSVQEMIEDDRNSFFFSAVSLWELAIKSALGKSSFQVDVRQLHSSLLENGYAELTLSSRHAFSLETLPPIHKDPFDRILIAQAMREDMVLLTSDKMVGRYGEPIRLVL